MGEEINHDRVLGTAVIGMGHKLPQEGPQALAEAVVEVDGY